MREKRLILAYKQRVFYRGADALIYPDSWWWICYERISETPRTCGSMQPCSMPAPNNQGGYETPADAIAGALEHRHAVHEGGCSLKSWEHVGDGFWWCRS